MRNIIEIFKSDIRNIKKSAIGLIVLVGLVIVPVLYAWFNIAGSWDPYGNTGNLKVAVANSDKGYESDLIPIRVSLGDSVTAALRENDALDWVFVDEDRALEGVKSGEYYAAVVIPADFSADMMTVFSSEVEHSDIIYYENQKANAIAPRVTDKGASTVRQQIDTMFASTIGDVGLATASGLMEFMDGDQVESFVANLEDSLGRGARGLREASQSAGSFAGLLGSASSTITATGNLLADAGSVSGDSDKLLADAKDGLADIQSALGSATSAVNEAIKQSAGSYDDVSAAVDEAFGAASTQSADTQKQLRGIAAQVGERAEATEALSGEIRALRDKVDAGGHAPHLVARLDAIISRVDSMAAKQRQLQSRLSGAADELAAGTADVEQARADIKDIIADAKAGIEQVKLDYETTLKGQAGELRESASSIAAAGEDISRSLGSTVGALRDASGSLAGDLSGVAGVLGDVSGTLGSAADDLEALRAELVEAGRNGDIEKVRAIIGSDPAALAKALSAPVALDRHAVYHIENYGSAMAPFYTILSLWVGGIVLAAMLKVGVSDSVRARLGDVRLHELYLGRFVLFALLALCQSTLVCAGDILFFGIQCAHPFQFLMTGWLASFVFCNIIYTLTVSFGDIGKALAVVLLVMQVAGSGGTFPIEMTADFFQAVYPFLPFTHGINAMHAAMAGAYGAEYWIEMGILASYLVPSLALGLLFRRPVIRANAWVIERLEETKLM